MRTNDRIGSLGRQTAVCVLLAVVAVGLAACESPSSGAAAGSDGAPGADGAAPAAPTPAAPTPAELPAAQGTLSLPGATVIGRFEGEIDPFGAGSTLRFIPAEQKSAALPGVGRSPRTGTQLALEQNLDELGYTTAECGPGYWDAKWAEEGSAWRFWLEEGAPRTSFFQRLVNGPPDSDGEDALRFCTEFTLRNISSNTYGDLWLMFDGIALERGYAFVDSVPRRLEEMGPDDTDLEYAPVSDRGMFNYGPLGPGEDVARQWYFYRAPGSALQRFRVSGDVVEILHEECGNGEDNNGDGIPDSGCGLGSYQSDCYLDADCLSGACAGAVLDPDSVAAWELGTCEPSGLGGACLQNTDCDGVLSCDGADPGTFTPGTCIWALGGVGDPCASDADCETIGLYCDTAASTCALLPEVLVTTSGLQGTGLELEVFIAGAPAGTLTIDENGTVPFPAPFANLDVFTIEVRTQPTGALAEFCDPSPALGEVVGGDASPTITVTCDIYPWRLSMHHGNLSVRATSPSRFRVNRAFTLGTHTLYLTIDPELPLSTPTQFGVFRIFDGFSMSMHLSDTFPPGSTVYAALKRNGQLEAWTSTRLAAQRPDAAVRAAVHVPDEGIIAIGGQFLAFSYPRRFLSAVTLPGPVPPHSIAMPVVNGAVRSILPDGDGGFYLGGDFTEVDGEPRARVAHIDRVGVLTAWAPEVNSAVYAMALYDGVIYLGGSLTAINGQPRSRVGAVDAATGVTLPWIVPTIDNVVFAIAVNHDNVYVGGLFQNVGGAARGRAAGFERSTATLLPWNPGFDSAVRTMLIEGDNLHVGGSFQVAAGSTVPFLAAFDTKTATRLSREDAPNEAVWSLAFHDEALFITGGFTEVGGVSRARVAAVDAATGALLPWDGGGVNAMGYGVLATDDVVLVGGMFLFSGDEERNRLAAFDRETGARLGWWETGVTGGTVLALAQHEGVMLAGGLFTGDGAVVRRRLAGVDSITGELSGALDQVGANGFVHTLATDGERLYIGGAFTGVGGETRLRLAVYEFGVGLLSGWPTISGGPVNALAWADDTLVVGGDFSATGGAANLRFIDTTTGTLVPDTDSVGGIVRAIAIDDTVDSVVYVGGDFTDAGGEPREHLAAFNLSTGEVYPISYSNIDGPINALTVANGHLYAAGDFTTFLGASRRGLGALDIDMASVSPWNPISNPDDPSGPILAIAADAETVYVGGGFTDLLEADPPRNHLASFAVSNGALGTIRTDLDGDVRTLLLVDEGDLFVGGFFLSVDDVPRTGFTMVDTMVGAILPGW